MSVKKHLKSLSFFNAAEAVVIAIAMIGRRMADLAPRYQLITKTNFDFYQQKGISIQKRNGGNILSFVSKFSGRKLVFSIRRKTTDIVIFDEILLNGGYWPAVELCKKNEITPLVIVDAGANIGSSVIFFKDVYPSAKIICVEPEEKNLLLLKENVALNRFQNIFFIGGGLWHKDEVLQMDGEFRGQREKELSFSLKQAAHQQAASGNIQGYSADTLMNQFQIDKIDILKIDIEGAEAQLFDTYENTVKILEKARVIAIELHDEGIDRFKFTGFIEQAGYHHVTFGEVTYICKSDKK